MMLNNKIFEVLSLTLSIFIVLLFLWIKFLYSVIDTQKSKIQNYQMQLVQAKQDYEKNLAGATKEIIKIQTKYITQKKYITKFVKDTNESDCNATNRLLSNFSY